MCNDMVYGELGAFPLDIYIKSRMIRYWSRLISGKHTKLCFIMYQCLLELDRLGLYTSSWLACIKILVIIVECQVCGCSKKFLLQDG